MKLNPENLVSKFSFTFNLRRYNQALEAASTVAGGELNMAKVGRCRLTLSNPR